MSRKRKRGKSILVIDVQHNFIIPVPPKNRILRFFWRLREQYRTRKMIAFIRQNAHKSPIFTLNLDGEPRLENPKIYERDFIGGK